MPLGAHHRCLALCSTCTRAPVLTRGYNSKLVQLTDSETSNLTNKVKHNFDRLWFAAVALEEWTKADEFMSKATKDGKGMAGTR